MKLTRMQTEVYRRVCRGMSNMDIANELGLGEKTIKYHLGQIFVKAEVTSRAQLIVKYFEKLLVEDAGGG